MATLAKEYTDIKDIRHNVEHLVVPTNDKRHIDQLLDELFHALIKPKKLDCTKARQEIQLSEI